MCTSREGAETPATASSTLVRNEKVGARKPRSQADAALGLQERGSVCCGTGGCMRQGGERPAGLCIRVQPGDLQGLPAAELSRLVDTLCADRKDDELRESGGGSRGYGDAVARV